MGWVLVGVILRRTGGFATFSDGRGVLDDPLAMPANVKEFQFVVQFNRSLDF